MCDRDELLNQLKDRQVSPGEVKCTCTHKCWCNQLSFRFPVEQQAEECMSPTEMLEQYGNLMDKDDVNYLKSLSSKTFIKS
jgi:hypothetical protein